MMKTCPIPGFEDRFPDMEEFLLKMVKLYKDGKLTSWDDLERQVVEFFTPEKMEQMESIVPGWQKMASYSDGITLVHVLCVYLGMYMLPEFHALRADQQNIMKWIILFHDIDKSPIPGKKDTMHAFRSGVVAANRLPRLGFPSTAQYPVLIQPWSEYTVRAFIENEGSAAPTPDNRKLPQILSGIEQLFGQDAPAALIVKTALLHISLYVSNEYPTPAPLSQAEARLYFNAALFPLLRVMMVSDNEGWSLFLPQARKQRREATLAVFVQLQKLIF
ncbi:MAG: hypothetical protein ACM3XO_01505 [Bacteroidota bacterium]